MISGGDRHACEPAACLNLTNAASFGEFVAESTELRDDQLMIGDTVVDAQQVGMQTIHWPDKKNGFQEFTTRIHVFVNTNTG